MAEGFAPIEIVCCYAREDEMWLRKLETHLSLLKRQKIVSLWHDRLVVPGTDWAKTIDTHLETASVILLLVSSDFFASDYCSGIEMQRALERQEAGEARVIPILVRPTDQTDAPFARLQVLPTDARPIVSWRNKDTALSNVVAGIRRVIAEELPLLSVSVPRTALPKTWNIPYPRNPFFLGRESELAQVRQRLQAGQTTALSQPQAISGLGGIGKTQLALEYAYRYSQDYQAILWVRAESVDALISSYIALASLLRLPEREAKEQEITVQAVKTWLKTHQSWLLILDNADELAILPDFLPGASGGHILLTTRAAATGRLAHRLEIETWFPEQGALFLLRRAGFLALDTKLSQASAKEQKLALRISQELGGLPLALDQAGAYLEETGTNLADYWLIFQQYRTNLLQERRGLVPDYPSSVATTWFLSFQRVEERNPAAAELLHLCAFLAPDIIAEEILTTEALSLGPIFAPVAGNIFLLNQAIEVLRAYSLLRRDPKEKILSIHRLVQAVLRDGLNETERRTWAERAMVAVNAAFPKSEVDTLSQCERLLPQALAAAHGIEQYQIASEEAGRLLYETANYLVVRARYGEAEPLYQRALRIREQLLGPEHLQVAETLIYLAYLYQLQGRYEEGEPLCQRALRIEEQLSGSEHQLIAETLNILAGIFSQQGKYAEAEQLDRRALAICEQLFGSEHPDSAVLLANLALNYTEQGKYAEGEQLCRRVLAICEPQWGSEHPDLAYPLAILANLSLHQGKYAEGEQLCRRALAIWEQQLGPEHPYVTHPLTILANLYREQGKYAEAEPLYQRALRTREQQWGFEHPFVMETMHDLARFWEMQGNSEEARNWYTRALEMRLHVLGTLHPKTAQTRKRLIALLYVMGLHEEAVQLEMTQVQS